MAKGDAKVTSEQQGAPSCNSNCAYTHEWSDKVHGGDQIGALSGRYNSILSEDPSEDYVWVKHNSLKAGQFAEDNYHNADPFCTLL